MISKKAQNIAPYTAGEQPQGGGYIKLNTNENAYPPSPQIKEYLAGADISNLRLYPDPANVKLRTAIAAAHGVGVENVFVGNGSDEVLALAFLTLFERTGGSVVFADVTYSFYKVYAELYDLPYKEVALDGEYRVRVGDYVNDERRMTNDELRSGVSGIVLANPNAPTSVLLERGGIEKILTANKDIPVIVDEAYIDFAGEGSSCVPLINKYKNLVVVKTFSKSHSLAGARVGYAIAGKPLIDALFKIKDCFNSYPLDKISADISAIAIADKGYYQGIRDKVVATRDRVATALRGMNCTVLPSSANFLFVSVAGYTGAQIYEYLKDQKILVRTWNKPRISDFVRITIGTDAEMDKLLEVWKKFCK